MAAKTAKKTYLLELKNGGERKLTVPATWKVTFGPTTPYEKKNGGGYGQEVWALRLYESGTKLRAIFTDVKSFRDMEISLLEKKVKVKRQAMEKAGRKGGRAVVVEAKVEEWINPDDPDDTDVPTEYLQINHSSGGDDDAESEDLTF